MKRGAWQERERMGSARWLARMIMAGIEGAGAGALLFLVSVLQLAASRVMRWLAYRAEAKDLIR